MVKERGSGHKPLLSLMGEVTDSDIAGAISSRTGEGAGGAVEAADWVRGREE